MTNDFYPEINSRTTDELLEMVGSPAKWDPLAVSLAHNELLSRNVEPIKIEMAEYLADKRQRIDKKIKANTGYHICDLIIKLRITIAEILFSWELKKDGFPKKARQQRKIRLILLFMLMVYLCYLLIMK